jgi:hypothetical protein
MGYKPCKPWVNLSGDDYLDRGDRVAEMNGQREWGDITQKISLAKYKAK